MIELQGLNLTYGGDRAALRDVTLRIERGEFVFLVGATGAGKSTLLRLLYRDMTPTSGRIAVAGEDLVSMRRRDVPRFRRALGVVAQDFGLLADRNVYENVAFALRVIGAGRREIRRRVPDVLELVGVIHRPDAFPAELSGGERQRVAIARALVNEPKLLLADEPTGNLDPDTSLGIAEILHRINVRGTTVVVATHDKYMVDHAARRVVEIERGRIVRDEEIGGYDRPVGEAPAC
ncbi:MAG: cell division ATP-binding protein FtsE [Armatimonadetes bacterium]|nr:cell division ATP-binding protein FtsE [Armatimonadota bacterium]